MLTFKKLSVIAVNRGNHFRDSRDRGSRSERLRAHLPLRVDGNFVTWINCFFWSCHCEFNLFITCNPLSSRGHPPHGFVLLNIPSSHKNICTFHVRFLRCVFVALFSSWYIKTPSLVIDKCFRSWVFAPHHVAEQSCRCPENGSPPCCHHSREICFSFR